MHKGLSGLLPLLKKKKKKKSISYSPEPVNVTLFGKIVFVNIINFEILK